MSVVMATLEEGSAVTATWRCVSSSPLLLLLVHGHAAGPAGHDQQQSTNHRGGLEEVVLQEVVHGFVGRNVPEGIEGHVDDDQPDDERQSRQLGLEPDGHQHYQGCAHQVLQNLNTQKKNMIMLHLNSIYF